MTKDSKTELETQTIDKEWIVLIAAAKELGLTQQEILAFLRHGHSPLEANQPHVI